MVKYRLQRLIQLSDNIYFGWYRTIPLENIYIYVWRKEQGRSIPWIWLRDRTVREEEIVKKLQKLLVNVPNQNSVRDECNMFSLSWFEVWICTI